MNELILMRDKNAVTTSLIVAEVFGKEHRNVLRDIREFQKDVLNFEQMFMEGDSPDSYGRSRKVYFMNRDGFTLLAMGFTGKEALKFKLQFIDEFNRMEEYIQSQQVPETNLELALRAALEHETKIKEIQSDVGMLKDTMRIDGGQEYAIRTKANAVVTKVLGGKESPAYQQANKKVFSAFWREFKQHFTLPRYGDLPRVKFDDAMRYIDMWRPQTNLVLEIQELNGQQTMEWSDEDEQ